MKKLLVLIIGLFFSIALLQAQNDTVYFMKGRKAIAKYATTDIDSIVFYGPTLETPFTDIRDGNVYQTVLIGNQVWMAENLKYLPSVVGRETGSEDVGFENQPFYYVYGYDGTDVAAAKLTENYNTYGVQYNWYAAMQNAASSDANPSLVQGVCPAGWHLPSNAEWLELSDYLGDITVAGGKLKEEGLTHWSAPNMGATNETGFTALPGSARYFDIVLYLGDSAEFWTSTVYEYGYGDSANRRMIKSDVSNLYEGINAFDVGSSVRCVWDY